MAKNKKNRLGATGGWKEILAHPFFEGLDVEKLLKKQLKPKYMPDINEGEFKYFDQRLVKNDELAMSVIPQEQMNMIKKKKELFNNF